MIDFQYKEYKIEDITLTDKQIRKKTKKMLNLVKKYQMIYKIKILLIKYLYYYLNILNIKI